MAAEPLVSVCIPVLNRAPFIWACLTSAAADPYPRKELVILDDGSTDGSDAIIDRWIAHHPDVPVIFEKQPNSGIPRACNRLKEMACGQLLAWLGSDDFLLPGGIAARVAYLNENPGKLAVFGDARVIDERDRILFDHVYGGYRRADKRRFSSSSGLRRELLTRWCVPQPVLMVRREIYDVVGPYDESLLFEDFDFYLRMLACDALGYLDAVVAAYRVHSGNHSRSLETRLPVMRQFPRIAMKNRRRFSTADQCVLLAYASAVALKGLIMKPLAWGERGRDRG